MDSSSIDRATEIVTELMSSWGLRVVGALAVLIIGWLVAKVVRGWTRRMLTKSRLDDTMVPFFAKLAYYLTLTFVLLAVLSLSAVGVAFSACKSSTSPDNEAVRTRESQERTRES